MTSLQGKAMTSDRRNRMASFGVAALMLMALSCTKASAQQQMQEAVKTAPEPAPQQPPANNWFNVSTPGVRALARPGSMPEYGPPPGGVCCPGKKNGHFCR